MQRRIILPRNVGWVACNVGKSLKLAVRPGELDIVHHIRSAPTKS